MGTHPIFESDFDCLTECARLNSRLVENAELIQVQTAEIWSTHSGRVIRSYPTLSGQYVRDTASMTNVYKVLFLFKLNLIHNYIYISS